MMTLAEIVAKRRRSWEKRHDVEYDRKLTASAAEYILANAELRQEVRKRPYLLIEICFTIVDKEKRTVPFFLNEVQREFIRTLEEHGGGRPYYVLKGRQQGFTSLITAIQLCYAITQRNFAGFTIADSADNTLAIFNDKAKATYGRLAEILHPHEQYNSRNELFFDKLNSSWRIATATDEVGRSRTLNFLHMSEIAFFRVKLSDIEAAIGQALTSNAIVIYETTANGYNESKTLWDSGACRNLFFEWWKTSEYRSTDLTVLDTPADGWIADRIAWLRDKGLEDSQIAWYVAKYNAMIDKTKLRQEYPCTPEEAFVSSGETVFNADIICRRLDAVRGHKPLRRGRFVYRKKYTDNGRYTLEDVRFVEEENGFITIHEAAKVEEELTSDKKYKTGRIIKTPYTIGGDTAGDGSDYFTAKVIDNRTGHTAATLRVQKIDEDEYGEQVACLGYMYNDALIAVEVNYSIVPNRVLEQVSYPNVYRRQRLDTLTNIMEARVGFMTTSVTRPVVIADLVRLMRDTPEIESDEETLKEMLTFCKNENGRPEAQIGCHDDLVMALAIGHFCRQEQGRKDLIIEGHVPSVEDLFGTKKKEKGGYMTW